MNKKHQKEKTGFEFCKVCKLNHNQGRRHNYFPNHTKSLSSFLSRFLKKLSDVRFFLKTPTLLRPEHASSNRLWCVFCDLDIQELDSLFVCDNAIRHLASSVHLKNLKDFLWRYGGAMDGVDSFRVSDTELTQWEKKCTTLTDATPSSGRTSELLVGDSKGMRRFRHLVLKFPKLQIVVFLYLELHLCRRLQLMIWISVACMPTKTLWRI